MKSKVFISGGSKGIGLAIARRFYSENFEVIICARGSEALERAKSQMPGLHTFVCDISNKAEVKTMVTRINHDFGALDVLVNNGGTFLPGLIMEEDDASFEKMIQTNLHSAYYISKGLVPKMVANRKGTIFNMCSVASLKAYPNGSSYSVSKFALLGFSKSLREEMKPHNIRVVSVMPGAVLTPSWDGVDLPEERFIPATDIADLIWNAWAMSDRTVIEEIVIRPALGDI